MKLAGISIAYATGSRHGHIEVTAGCRETLPAPVKQKEAVWHHMDTM
jgi:hypothetical protein